MTRTPKRPRDPNQLAKMIVEIATDEAGDRVSSTIDEGRQRGGRVGGKARAEILSGERRSQISRTAAETRWKKND